MNTIFSNVDTWIGVEMLVDFYNSALDSTFLAPTFVHVCDETLKIQASFSVFSSASIPPVTNSAE